MVANIGEIKCTYRFCATTQTMINVSLSSTGGVIHGFVILHDM